MGSNNKQRFLLVYFSILAGIFLLPVSAQEADANGESVFDLRESGIRNGYRALEGDWDFYWGSFYQPLSDFGSLESEIITVPEAWNNTLGYRNEGYATYRSRILLPKGTERLGLSMDYSFSHYRLFANGKLLYQVGHPAAERHVKEVNHPPTLLLLPEADELELVLHVSSYDDFYGGLLSAPVIGNYELLKTQKKQREIGEAFLAGILFVVAFLYILFYFNKQEESSSFIYFGLFALVLALRTTLYGEHLLLNLLPRLSQEMEAGLGHLTFYLAVPLIFRFIAVEYPFNRSRMIEYPLYLVSAAYCLLVIVSRHHVYIRFLTSYQLITMAILVTIFVNLLFKTVKGDRSARIILGGFFFLAFTAINDILYTQKVVETFHMVPLGMGIFILSQAGLLSWNIGEAFKETRLLAGELTTTNVSFRRFVPEEFLTYLKKERIADIGLGDHVQMDMTIMFLDIRDFTSLSERMSPEENFRFLNSYYRRVCPVIRENGGFIDKYLGDGIMALFPGDESADCAVKTAERMREILKTYNLHRASTGYDPIAVGIGIHSGTLMLGTIGENERMDGTVISDAVNLCSRIESLTKEYALSIALSGETFQRLSSYEDKLVRYIGMVPVKGKKEPVSIYELFNGDDEETAKSKSETRRLFSRAIRLRDRGKYDEAKASFEELLEIFPGDKTSRILLARFHKG